MNLIKKVYYFLLDLFTLRRGMRVSINNFPFRIPTRYYKYFKSDYEEENFRFFKEKCMPGMNIVDIGAHFGLFTVYMQKLSAGRVYSFEPTPSTLGVLRKTILLNKISDKVEIIPAAVADKNGKATFYIDKVPGAVANSLVQYGDRKNYTTEFEVEVVSLDDFFYHKKVRIDFIKIDAEGAEYSVLKGAKKILTEHRPIIILGMHPSALNGRNESSEMVWDFLAEKKYKVLFEGSKISKQEFTGKESFFDVHLLPEETTSM